MPWLEVLDQHVVTDAERRKAKALIGGDVVTGTVAFGKRVPMDDRGDPVGERSVLEQELGLVRQQRHHCMASDVCKPTASFCRPLVHRG